MRRTIPKILSIAGSDPSGGAGIQADMKTMSALGAYAMSVPTALTSQSTRGVADVYAVPVDVIRSQLEVLLSDIIPDAVKVGMLGSAQVIELMGEYLPHLSNVVLDPVMASTSQHPLLDDAGIQALLDLRGCIDLLTPNLGEAAVLLGCEQARTVNEASVQAKQLYDAGWQRVLLKGGHLSGQPIDVYVDAAGERIISAERVNTRHTHGTGCTSSSAIASYRGHQHEWYESVTLAKTYMNGALRGADSLNVGSGTGPLHHFHALFA